MKMKFGALVVDGRGKIGGHVASKNRGGSYLRTKVTPVNRNTGAQLIARSLLTSIAQAWRGLTQAQRNSWNSAVNSFKNTNIFGDIKTPSGFNLFQKLNNNLAQVDVGVIDSPPEVLAIPALLNVVLTGVAATSLTVAFTDTPIAADYSMVVDMTPGLSAGVSFVKSEYRRVTVVASAETSPQVLTVPFVAKFGSVPQAGTRVFIRMRLISELSGQGGAWSYANVTL